VNAHRFARTSRLCNFNCILTTVQLDDGEPCNLQFRLYPIKMLPRLTQPSDFCERANRFFFRSVQFTTPTTGRPIHGDAAAIVKTESAYYGKPFYFLIA